MNERNNVSVRNVGGVANDSFTANRSKRVRKCYSVIWSGRCWNGKLIYGEDGYPDYKIYDIENYDITCVVGG